MSRRVLLVLWWSLAGLPVGAATPESVATAVVAETESYVTAELRAVMNRLGDDEASRLRAFATLSLLNDMPAAAAWAYAKLVLLRPSDYAANNSLGWCLVAAGKLDSAEVVLQHAKRQQPTSAAVLSNLAKYHAARGNLSQARAAVQAAAAAAPDDDEVSWQRYQILSRMEGVDEERRQLARQLRAKDLARLKVVRDAALAWIDRATKQIDQRAQEHQQAWRQVIGSANGGVHGGKFQQAIERRRGELEQKLATETRLFETLRQQPVVIRKRIADEYSRLESAAGATWFMLRDPFLDNVSSSLHSIASWYAATSVQHLRLSYLGTAWAVDQGACGQAGLVPQNSDYWTHAGTAGDWFDQWYPVYEEYLRREGATADMDLKRALRNSYLNSLPSMWGAWRGRHTAWVEANQADCSRRVAQEVAECWLAVAAARDAAVVTRGLMWSCSTGSGRLRRFSQEMLEKATKLNGNRASWTQQFLDGAVKEYTQRAKWNPTDACGGNNKSLPGPGDTRVMLVEGPPLAQYLGALKMTWYAETLDLKNLTVTYKLGKDRGISISGDGTIAMQADVLPVYRVAKSRVMGSWNFKTDEFSIGTGVYVTGSSIVEALSAGAARQAAVSEVAESALTSLLDFEVGGRVYAKGRLVGGLGGHVRDLDVMAGVSYSFTVLKPFGEKVESSYQTIGESFDTSLTDAVAGSYQVMQKLAGDLR